MNSPPDRSLTEVIDRLTLRLQVLERACGLFPEHYLPDHECDEHCTEEDSGCGVGLDYSMPVVNAATVGQIAHRLAAIIETQDALVQYLNLPPQSIKKARIRRALLDSHARRDQLRACLQSTNPPDVVAQQLQASLGTLHTQIQDLAAELVLVDLRADEP